MPDVYIDGKRRRLDPAAAIGKGGEADVYDLGGGTVLKLFKPPDHPDLDGLPDEQQAARRRILEHQKKLPAFPRGLPPKVVVPQGLVKDSRGTIIGYTMPFLQGGEVLMRYTQKSFRQGVPSDDMRDILRDLHTTVTGVHGAHVVIGDFNDLNVIVIGKDAHLIDADSMQFGGFRCGVYTTRFVDPLLCDPAGKEPKLMRPHGMDSDWYAFTVMVMQCFLFVDPYGGIYQPKDPAHLVRHPMRPLKRITVFHPEVRYPKPAVPYGMLPDELLQHLHRVFEKDERGAFPVALLERMRWTKCTSCGTEHARPTCPHCSTASPVAVKETITVRGHVTATRIFSTRGLILRAELQNGKLLWLSHEGKSYRREDGAKILEGDLDPRIRYRLRGPLTYLGKDDLVIKLTPSGTQEAFRVDVADGRPIFDTNEHHIYWTEADRLWRDGMLGPEPIGDVLSGKTHVWTGPTFGFGLYRAAQLSVAFVFNAKARGINDTVKLPPIRGKLVDAHSVFTKDRCWFFVSTQDGTRLVNRCTVIKADGTIEASAEAEAGDGTWLGQIRGGAAAANFLLMPTDDGVVRIEADVGRLKVTKTFPDTEPFVQSNSRLFAAPDGLYVVGQKEVIRLAIK